MKRTQAAAAATTPEKAEPGGSAADAQPKQVALAMDRLGRAGRLIADVRLGADRLLEALLATADPHQSSKSIQLIVKEEASMREHLQNLRILVTTGSLEAILKNFEVSPRIYQFLASRTNNSSHGLGDSHKDDHSEGRTLSDILINLEKEAPNLRISTYQRLDWLKRASSLSSSANENLIDTSRERTFHNPKKLRLGLLGVAAADQIAVIELLVPSVFRAVLSLHPAGSTNPDAVAVFSPDEGGNYVHARGFSVYHVFRHITEHADKALRYFLSVKTDTALSLLLHWTSSYQSLFTEACSKCGRLLIMDKTLGLLLPPVHRPYRQTSLTKFLSTQSTPSTKDQNIEPTTAYHIGCYSDEV